VFDACSTLTSCVHAVLSLLYPFDWHHMFIPVLPSSLVQQLDSPLPYIIGILSSTYAQLLSSSTFQFDEVFIPARQGVLTPLPAAV